MRFYTAPSIRLYVTMPYGNGPKTGWTHLWILSGLCRKALPSWVAKADSFLGVQLEFNISKGKSTRKFVLNLTDFRFCRPFTVRIKKNRFGRRLLALASSRIRTTPWSQMRVDARMKIGPFWAIPTCVSSGTIYKLPKTNKLLNLQETSVVEGYGYNIPSVWKSAILDKLSLRRLTWLCHHRIESFKKSHMLTASVWFSALHLSLLHYYTILYMVYNMIYISLLSLLGKHCCSPTQ